VGQQEVHEYEALSGCPGGYLYCWLILFCQSLQTILRIILDITIPGSGASGKGKQYSISKGGITEHNQNPLALFESRGILIYRIK